MRLIFIVFCLLGTLTTPTIAEEGGGQNLQNLVDELKQLTSKARQQRAADRWLLNDLEDLVARFDWPWRDELLNEDFSDGDYDRDPQWRVVSGQFWIDGRLGLRSRTQVAEAEPEPEQQPQRQQKQDLGKALLGALLQEALRDDRQQQQAEPEPTRSRHDEPAEIHLPLAIPKVFAGDFEFSVHNRPSEQGRLSIGILQDEQGRYGYRVGIATGERPYLELATLRGGRAQVIDSADLADISDGTTHLLTWRRDPNGQIEILIDESPILKTRDNSFRNAFRWLAIANHSGDFAISQISLLGRK